MQLSNVPRSVASLRVARAKSYAFGLEFKRRSDELAHNLTGAEVRFRVRNPKRKGGAMVVSVDADIYDANDGLAQVNLQASDLDLPAGDYPFSLSLLGASGYSSLVLDGTLTIVDNAEDESTTDTYADVDPFTSLVAWMESGDVVQVQVALPIEGDTPLPGGFNEQQVEDEIVDTLVAGANITLTWNAVTRELTIASAGGGGGGSYTDADAIAALGPSLAALSDAINLRALASRQIISGAGLTGGGDLTANRTLAVAYGEAANTAVQGNDPRILPSDFFAMWGVYSGVGTPVRPEAVELGRRCLWICLTSTLPPLVATGTGGRPTMAVLDPGDVCIVVG